MEQPVASVTVIDGPPAPPSEDLQSSVPLLQEADPEIEKLLEEEEAIERAVVEEHAFRSQGTLPEEETDEDEDEKDFVSWLRRNLPA